MSDRIPLLTPRERQCLELVGDGLRSKEIARELGISPRTVDGYIASAVATLEASGRTEAATMLSRKSPPAILPGEPQRLVSTDAAAATFPPDRIETTRWWRRLPVFRDGDQDNDLTSAERLIWIFFGAVGIVFGLAQLASGLDIAHKIALDLSR